MRREIQRDVGTKSDATEKRHVFKMKTGEGVLNFFFVVA